MKRWIEHHVTGKMLAGLLAAEVISLILAVCITFFVTKPRLERQTLEQAVCDGERLADEIDGILDTMCRSMEYLCSSPQFTEGLDSAGSGDPASLVAELSGLCRFDTLDIRAAAAWSEKCGWYRSETEFTAVDELFLISPSMLALRADNPGPVVANFYTAYETNDTINIGIALPDKNGMLWRVVFLFDAGALTNAITNVLSYDYTGFEIGRVNGPGFFAGGNYGNAHAVLSENTAAGSYTVSDDSGLYIITQTAYNWRICGYISERDFSAEYMPQLKTALLLCLVMFAASLVVLLPLTQGMLRPISTLRETMTRAAAGDLDARAHIPTEDEFHQLGEYFNNMMGQIKAHTDDTIKLEISEQNLRHSLLLSQVNYHFIYNTMSTINALARKGDHEKILLLNTALANILHEDMLVQNGEMICTLGQELSVVENYWAIEQISHKGNAALSISCPEELKELIIPKSILQPLVENSLRHGLVDEESGELRGLVTIAASQRDGQLVLQVTDNGRGIEPAVLQKLMSGEAPEKNGRHIGLSNIRKRLEYLYGGKTGFYIASGRGTSITITLPMERSARDGLWDVRLGAAESNEDHCSMPSGSDGQENTQQMVNSASGIY